MTDTWPLPSRIWPSIGRFGEATEIARAALFLASDESSYLVSVNAVIPGIMAGNVVILKVSHQTPLVAGRYAEAFNEAGFPMASFSICTPATMTWPG